MITRLARHHSDDAADSAAVPGVGRVDPSPVARRSAMARWRQRLFRLLARTETRAAALYGLPPERVREVEVPVEL
jgi:hypothetical protein